MAALSFRNVLLEAPDTIHRMIVQQLPSSYRLITQEQHALASGIFAHAWRGIGKKTALHGLLVQTVGLHDNPWRSIDSEPHLDEATGRPHDFVSLPMDSKLLLYGGGIDQLERVHPYVALLVSLHYTTFSGTVNMTALQKLEKRRRARIKRDLPESLANEDRWQKDLSFLKLFDNLSLFAAMTTPTVIPESVPTWMDPTQWARDPVSGAELSLDWLDNDTIEISPFPFAGNITIHFFYREISGNPYTSQEALMKKWDKAKKQIWTVTFSG